MSATATTEANESSGRLNGSLGTGHLFFTVLAYNAPLAVSVGFIPVIVAFGNRNGTPVSILVVGAIVGVFSAGFVAMSKHLAKPGGFYAFITAGLGRTVGLGASFLALISYYFMLIGNYAYVGIAAQSLVRDTFHGPNLGWWVWMLIAQAAVGILGYLRIDLSAKVLSVLLVCEIIMVLVFDAFVTAHGGAHGLGGSSFTRPAFLSGSVGLGLMYATNCFGGFEATVIFREEVRQPDRTIPRATYLVVAFVAVLYAFTAWAFIQSYGAGNVVAAAAANPTGSFLASLQSYVGRAAVDVVTVLLTTSVFAGGLSAHNITTRYAYNLSCDGIFPRPLARAHPRHGSPFISSVTVSVAAFVGLAVLTLAGTNHATLYAVLIGIYSYTLAVLLLVTSIAIPVYLWRHSTDAKLWQKLIAPVIAIAGFGVVAYLSTVNFADLLSGSPALAHLILIGLYALTAFGCVLALVFRKYRPETYARIGRQ